MPKRLTSKNPAPKTEKKHDEALDQALLKALATHLYADPELKAGLFTAASAYFGPICLNCGTWEQTEKEGRSTGCPPKKTGDGRFKWKWGHDGWLPEEDWEDLEKLRTRHGMSPRP